MEKVDYDYANTHENTIWPMQRSNVRIMRSYILGNSKQPYMNGLELSFLNCSLPAYLS